MNIKPLADRVLILPKAAEEKTIGGIIIPDTAKEKPLQGEVVAVGNGTKDEEMVIKVGDNVLAERIELVEYPLVLKRELVRFGKLDLVDGEVHTNEARCVPELICKVSCRLDLLVGESHIVTGSVTRCKSKAERICAVLLDNLKGIDTVAEGFRHFSTLRVTNKTVYKNRVERNLSRLLYSREHHTHNPEWNNIITSN